MRIKRNLYYLLAIGILSSGLLFGLASVCRAETKEEGMYFSILGVENYIEGDFDGKVNGSFLGTTVLARIPKIESGKGFGILIGGYKGKLAGELYYSCSNHDTTFNYSDYNCNGIEDPGEDIVYSEMVNAKWLVVISNIMLLIFLIKIFVSLGSLDYSFQK